MSPVDGGAGRRARPRTTSACPVGAAGIVTVGPNPVEQDFLDLVLAGCVKDEGVVEARWKNRHAVARPLALGPLALRRGRIVRMAVGDDVPADPGLSARRSRIRVGDDNRVAPTKADARPPVPGDLHRARSCTAASPAAYHRRHATSLHVSGPDRPATLPGAWATLPRGHSPSGRVSPPRAGSTSRRLPEWPLPVALPLPVGWPLPVAWPPPAGWRPGVALSNHVAGKSADCLWGRAGAWFAPGHARPSLPNALPTRRARLPRTTLLGAIGPRVRGSPSRGCSPARFGAAARGGAGFRRDRVRMPCRPQPEQPPHERPEKRDNRRRLPNRRPRSREGGWNLWRVRSEDYAMPPEFIGGT